MILMFALIVIFWWIAIWGLFELTIKDYTDNDKAKVYLFIIAIIIIIVCFFPRILYHL